MKKFVVFLLTAILLICIIPTFSACKETPSTEIEVSRLINATEDLSYVLKEDGYWVDTYTGNSTVISIPDKYNGKDVVGIVPNAFSKLDKIDTLSMPATIKLIKNIKNAFKNKNDENFTVKTLEACADNVVFLPLGIRMNVENLYLYGKELHEQAFSCASSIRTLKLAEGIVKIGNYAFQDCHNLKVLVFPASLEVLSPYAFIRVYAHTIVFSKGTKIKEIGEACFNSVYDSLKVVYYGGTPESLRAVSIDGYFNTHFLNFIRSEENVVFF